MTSSQGLVRRSMRGQDLSSRLYAEHRSCRKVTPLGNFTCKCDLRGLNAVNHRNIHHQFNRTGKLHESWETLQVFWGRARFHGSLSCSEWHLFLIQCTVFYSTNNGLGHLSKLCSLLYNIYMQIKFFKCNSLVGSSLTKYLNKSQRRKRLSY